MSVEVLKQIWPEWQIEDQPLGKGSFGVVYKAVRKDHNVESYAAIKALSIPVDSAEMNALRSEGLDVNASKTYLQAIVNDFVGEIQLMESLKGVQNIVSVEDYKVVEKTNEIGWYIFIRMELLTSFNTYICDKKLSEEEIIKLGCDICTALEICAKRNIVHRDIKPENIFINDFGHFKLGDFGIARKMENMTGGLSQKGTFNYIAPEVANSSEYDARVDIYSLGIVLYRLLNGNRLPFLNTEKQLINPNERRNAVDRRIQGEKLPPPCEASPEMADVILRACAYDPDMRFASAEDMKEALMSVAAGTYKMNENNTDATVSVNRAPDQCDKTTAVRKAPGGSDQYHAPSVNTFDSTPNEAEKRSTVIDNSVAETCEKKVFANPVAVAKENNNNRSESRPQKQSKFSLRKLVVFGLPPVLLLMCIGFYAVLIPALYGGAVSFFDWILADVNHILELLRSANIVVAGYVIVLLVIWQYVLWSGLIVSLFFMAKELHNPKVKFDDSVKYSGKNAQIMLENISLSMKNNAVSIDRSTLDTLRTVSESMKYSKPFGVSNNINVVTLEKEICKLIDNLQDAITSNSDNAAEQVSSYIIILKQKSILRDTMLKK